MKTRIIHTKFWDDGLVSEFDVSTKIFFIYYFTNELIGLTGIYEVTDRRVVFDTGLMQDQLKVSKEKLSKTNRIYFYKDWVYVINAQRLGGYRGEKIHSAVLKEINRIPPGIYNHFSNSVSMPYVYPIDTPINKKPETINQQSEIIINEEENIKKKDGYEISTKEIDDAFDNAVGYGK